MIQILKYYTEQAMAKLWNDEIPLFSAASLIKLQMIFWDLSLRYHMEMSFGHVGVTWYTDLLQSKRY